MWVKLDDGFFLHPKAQAAGKDGRALFVAGLCWSAGQLTDGHIPKPTLPVIAGMAGVRPSAAKLLVACGLWHDTGDGYTIHDFLEYQPSAATERAKRVAIAEKRREAGKRGAHARWSDANSDGKPMANGMANASQSHSKSMAPSPSPSPTHKISSSSNARTPPAGDDDDPTSSFDNTVEAIVERRLHGRHVDDPDRYRAATRRGVIGEHGDRIGADLALGITPADIARSIAPLPTDRIPAHATTERIW